MSQVEQAIAERLGVAGAAPDRPLASVDVSWSTVEMQGTWFWRHLPAGPPLEAALAGLPPLADLDDATLLEVAAAEQRLVAYRQGRLTTVLAEFARRRTSPIVPEEGPWASGRCSGGLSDFAGSELGARLRWTPRTAQRRLQEAERLAGCLPATLAALCSGVVDYPRAQVVVTATEMLTEEGAERVDAALADQVARLTTSELRAAAAREVAAVDAAAAARRAEQGRRNRRVLVGPLPDGMAELCATGPAADVAAIFSGLTAAAGQRAPGDVRGIDARRFDALTHWAAAASGDATGFHRAQPSAVRLPVLVVAESTSTAEMSSRGSWTGTVRCQRRWPGTWPRAAGVAACSSTARGSWSGWRTESAARTTHPVTGPTRRMNRRISPIPASPV